MKYIIASCDKKAGTIENDSGDLTLYFELGWEFLMSRMLIIKMLKEKLIDPDKDIIVTNDTRQFLYSKFFKNVISYSQFLEKNIENDIIINLVELIDKDRHGKFANELSMNIWEIKNNKLQFKYSKEEAPEITSFDVLDDNLVLKDDNDFICILVRKRNWCSNRSYSTEEIKKCIKYATDKKLTVYVFGKGCEEFNDKNVYSMSLQEITSIINNKKCKAFISPLSGGGIIRMFTGNCFTITFDMEKIYNQNYPLLWGNGAIFSDLNKNNWKIVGGFDEDVLKMI